MLTLLLLFFTILPLTLTHTLKPTRRLGTSTCHRTAALQPADCASLLEDLQKERWTQVPVTFGRLQGPVGYTPKVRHSATCQFALTTLSLADLRIDTFTFADYMPAILELDRDCFGTGKGNVATLNVGSENVFYVRLGGVPPRANATVKYEGRGQGVAGVGLDGGEVATA